MSRILLIFPPSLYRNFTPPLNLAYVAAALEASGHDVKILDLSALHPPCDEAEAIRIARRFDPLWIGLTLNVIFIKPAYEFIASLRTLGKPIVVGGPHPSLLADEAIRNGCDFVVRGEGERTAPELTAAIEQSLDLSAVRGLSFRNSDGDIIHTPPQPLIRDLDTLPYPAKHLFPKDWYANETLDYQVYGPVFSGRGCPANCSYCYKGVFGHGCRLRSAESVFDEMRMLHDTHGVTAFEFMDDAFSADLNRVDALCDMILSRFPNPIRWQCTTRMDLTTRELLRKMRRSGCFRIFYGVETGDRESLLRVNKHLDLEQARTVLEWTREAGIRSIVGYMWGFPWDSPASVRQSLRYLQEIAPSVDEFNPLGVLIPVPGTGIYEEYSQKHGLESWWMSDRFGRIYRSNTYFPYHMRRFYNDFALLDDGFFPFSASVRRLIRKGTHFIGFHNLFNNTPFPRALIIYAAVLLSKLLCRIHPRIEQAVFGPIGEIRNRLFRKRTGLRETACHPES